jgi:hypothetical protein
MINWILRLFVGNYSDDLLKLEVKQLQREILSNHRVMESHVATLQRQINKLKDTK